jgi:hypothetical protein
MHHQKTLWYTYVTAFLLVVIIAYWALGGWAYLEPKEENIGGYTIAYISFS